MNLGGNSWKSLAIPVFMTEVPLRESLCQIQKSSSPLPRESHSSRPLTHLYQLLHLCNVSLDLGHLTLFIRVVVSFNMFKAHGRMLHIHGWLVLIIKHRI